MENQQKIWDKIAPEWHEYKTKPAENVINFLKTTSGNILDLGSGSGRHIKEIKNGKMYLIDFSKKMLKLANQKAKKENIIIETKESNIWQISYENNFFDSAICISSLHCIEKSENREDTIKELYRVLKPKAKAYIGVWNIKSKRFKNAPKEKYIKWTNKGERYYYLYDEKEIHNLFKKNKFKIISTHNSEMMINFIVEK